MKFTIGLLFDTLLDEYENAIWQEIIKIAKRKELNLVSFAVGAINSPYEQNAKRNIIYNLITDRLIDGIIAFTASLGNFSNLEKIADIFKPFGSLPVVSIGARLGDAPAIMINNEVGMFQIMHHLIDYHKYKKIAFIKGPSGNKEAELRFQVYKNCLTSNKIPVEEDLIVQGDFCRLSGAQAVTTLLDERRAKFEAVVSANDYMALDAMIELERRGIHVPGDIAVTGFDDMFESRCTLHPITTVRQPSYKIALKAVELILSRLNNKDLKNPPPLAAKAVIRRSCGCFMYMHTTARDKSPIPSLRQQILEEMDYNFPDSVDSSLKETWVNRITSALKSSLDAREDILLRVLEEILIESFHNDINPLTWYPVISCMFNLLEKLYLDNTSLNVLWRESLILIGNIAEHAQANIKISKKMQEYNFHLIEEAFRNIFTIEKQKELMPKHLSEVGITNFYLGMYPLSGGTGEVRIISCYENNECTDISDATISVHDFLYDAVNRSGEPHIFVVFPIHSDSEQLGVAVISVGPCDGSVYERIASQLNATCHEATLLHRVQLHAEELEKEVQARTLELKQANTELANRNESISRLYKALEFKSKQDGLTGLFNRTAIYEFLERGFKCFEKSYWKKENTRGQYRRRLDKAFANSLDQLLEQKLDAYSLIMIDIDHFKRINDTYGHLFGDTVLLELGKLLLSSELFRKIDVCGRFGGEEFIIVLPFTEAVDAMSTATRLKNKLDENRPRLPNGETITVTLSMGISKYYPSDQSSEEVINRADMALYYAKEHGRNRIINYADVKEELERWGSFA